ncbi:hypothetical protein KVR01_008114 [Diaporthe batatas]|uniref:uncharacterized protein n=1 Tax=Diaporthe batatas TaxID=748121 RepID=UPI001D03C064|nr:uncharacterized protein KVR01_008114 [Diaporthe batatas]KAG8162349.1 hypothetical protein KVR01_008114 [Diaporthe batatas]
MGSDLVPPAYLEGTELSLVVDKANETLPGNVKATVTREISATMSTVLEVTYTDDSSTTTKKAVLKLFDRRFGSSLRKMHARSESLPEWCIHATRDGEKAFRSYVQSGKASKLWHEIDADNEQMETIPLEPEQYYEPTEEGMARYEVALQRRCRIFFRNETAVYEKLAHVQGDWIPRMLAHVHLASVPLSETDEKTEDKAEDSPFLRVDGVLLEYVSGIPLSELENSPPLPERGEWGRILQDVANMTEKINLAGVVMKDCRPENVLLRSDTWEPVFLDFGQTYVGDFDDEEAEFGLSVFQFNNPMGLLWNLVCSIKEKTGVVIDLNYPDYSSLVEGYPEPEMPVGI